FVNQPRCDISAFHPDSAGDCLGLNHTGFLPRSKPRFFRRRNGGSKFAQAETPHTPRTVADRMTGQLSCSRKLQNATPIEGQEFSGFVGVHEGKRILWAPARRENCPVMLSNLSRD